MATCEVCNKQFANEFGVRVHKARTHDKEAKTETVTEKPKKEKSPANLVRFCPCCGMNIAAVTVAVNYANK